MTAAKTQDAAVAPVDWATLSLEDALDLDFAGWNPNAGDKISGTVLFVTTSTEGEFGSYPILTVATDDGEGRSLHCFHTVLRNAVEGYRVSPGDRIGVKYNGKKKSKQTDMEYDSYNVLVQKAGQAELTAPAAALASGD